MRNTEISRVLGEMWKKASAEERAPHIEREAAEREKYKVAIAKWREEEAIRRREEVDEQKNKVLERAIDNGQSFQRTPKATLSTGQQRNSPLPFQGTSPLPIHESRSSSPGPNPPGSAPRYYPHGGYGYPVPNYGAPPPGYYPQSSYPAVQHSPQSQGYYSNYAPIPPVEYPHQRQYQEYPHPPPPPHSIPQVGNMDDHSRHFDHPLPVRYGGYYPPAPPNGSFSAVEGIPPSGSNAETEYSSEFPPQS